MKLQELGATKELDVFVKQRGWPTKRLAGTVAIMEEVVEYKDGTKAKVKRKRISRDGNRQPFAIIQTAEGFVFARPQDIKPPRPIKVLEEKG